MNNAILLTWKRPIPGREKMANELYASCLAFFDKQKDAKAVSNITTCIVPGHGDGLGGFFLVEVEPNKTHEVMGSNEFLDLCVRADYLLDSFGLTTCAVNEAVGDLMQRWQKLL